MTDETNTTPGPWTWHGDELLSASQFVMGTEKGSRPSDKDARLIAAAPDLLEAGKLMFGENLINGVECVTISMASYEAMRAAISKAYERSK